MVIVFVGPPGCGKGTQAVWLCRELGIPHVSTGDILRAEAAAGSDLGRAVEPLLRAGELVPDDLIVRIVAQRLVQPDAAGGAVLDGFPRTVAQARMLDELLAAGGRGVDLVVGFYAGEATILARLLARAGDQGRTDDAPQTIRRRYAEYTSRTLPVIAHYATRGTRTVEVDGERSIEAVRSRLRTHVAAAAATLGETELSGRAVPIPLRMPPVPGVAGH